MIRHRLPGTVALFLTAWAILASWARPNQSAGAVQHRPARSIEASTDVRAEAVLAKARLAVGGEARLAGFRSLVLENSDETLRLLFPDRYQAVTRTQWGDSIITLDGDRTWSISPTWPAMVPSTAGARTTAQQREAVQRFVRQLSRFSLMYRLRPSSLEPLSAIHAGAAEYGDIRGDCVEFRSHTSGDVVFRLVFSTPSGLPLALIRDVRTTPDGPRQGDAVTVLEDYREVAGIRVPFRLVERRMNQTNGPDRTMRTFQYTKIQINPPLAPNDFVEPRGIQNEAPAGFWF